MSLGARVLLAATCWVCGGLFSSAEFKYHRRRKGQHPYVDRRCTKCKWRAMEAIRSRVA